MAIEFGTPEFWDAVAEAMDKARDPVKAYVRDVLEGERAIEKAREDARKEAEKEAAKRAELNKKIGEGMATALTRVTSSITGAMNALTGFGSQLSQFVGKANPVAVMQFTMAVDNLQAVIGRALTPVLERVTFMVQKLGDAFVSLSPNAQGLIGSLAAGGGLAAVFGAVRIAVMGLMAALGPVPIIVGTLVSALGGLVSTTASGKQFAAALDGVLRAVGTVFEALATVVMPLVEGALQVVTPLLDVFAEAVRTVGSALSDALEYIGFESAANYNPAAKSATGAAVRPAQMTDLSSFASKAYTTAATGGAADIPKQSLDVLKEIRDELKLKRETGAGIAASGGRALRPFETGSDGKTNLARGWENIRSGKAGEDFGRGVGIIRERLASLLD